MFTDYGFTKQPSGIDLINHRRKIAVELKNCYRINSIVRREDFRRLKEFKRQHLRYIVILGFINDKTMSLMSPKFDHFNLSATRASQYSCQAFITMTTRLVIIFVV